MATQSLFHEQQVALHGLVQHWDRRLRTQQLSLWLPRCLLPGLVVGIIIAVTSRLRPWLLSREILIITGVLLVAGLVAMILAVWLWPRPRLAAARRFDLLFGLQERVSTALELIDGRIHSNTELTALQVGDAWTNAQQVRAGEHLPMIWRWREWAAVVILAAMLVGLILFPNPQAEAIAAETEQTVALDNARDELQQITQDIAADPALTSEERQELLEALEASMDTLRQPDVTLEEAFATLSDAQAALEDQAEQFDSQQQAQQAAMEAAGQSLSELQPADQSAPGQTTLPIPTLNNLSQNLANMSQAQLQQATQALQQAAQALQQTNPEAAQALQQAAQNIQQGNLSQAQQQLQQAAQSLEQQQQQAQGEQNSAQQLSQAAQSVQQAANQVGQQNQQGQQGTQNQQGQQGQNASQNQQGQQGTQNQQGQNASQNQQGQQGQQSSGQNGQQASQQGQSGQAGQQGQGSQQQGANAQSGSQGGQTGQQSQQTSGTGSGAGDNPGDAGGQPGSSQPGGQTAQNNNPDGEGQGQFDPVYAPQRIGGQGDEQIQLDPNASSDPIAEGNFSENPSGDASVPYNQVFSDYSNAANQALESDYIPLGLRDVVRDYFSSLEPGQNGNNNSNSGR